MILSCDGGEDQPFSYVFQGSAVKDEQGFSFYPVGGQECKGFCVLGFKLFIFFHMNIFFLIMFNKQQVVWNNEFFNRE